MKLKRNLLTVLTILLILTTWGSSFTKEVQASSKYITIEDYVTKVVKQLKLSINKKDEKPYLAAAIKSGIIKENEFTLSKNITRTDASVIIVRADELKYGVTIDDKMVDFIVDKRISDISKITKSKREYVAKAYALGYIKGYSNGSYSTNREFKGSSKLTSTGATDIVNMLTKTSKRAKISPDGQLIRTTNLPSNAKMYPYILASYPNAYYDWEFGFMKWTTDGKPIYGTDKLVNLKDYAAPKDIRKLNLYRWELGDKTIEDVYAENVGIWVEKAKKYVETVFNVDYRTLKNDTKWFNTIVELDSQYGWKNQKNTEERLKKYIDAAIKNKTIVESSIVGIDNSTLYLDKGYMYLRVYVKYRINSALDTSQVRLSPIVYSTMDYCNYANVVLGKWRHGYFDISLGPNGNGDLSPGKFGIYKFMISDYHHDTRVVTK